MKVDAPAVPNLPLPKDQFDKLYLNQLTNVLRLYFNQVGNVLEIVVKDIPTNQVYIIANLPTPEDAGIGFRAFVTDSSVTTFGSVVVAGGTNNVPIYFDGVDWRVG
jgi:hypothetical protein